jgi:chaperonin GroES
MNVPIQPVGDFIVAVQDEAATKTASGLYLPEKSGEKPKLAKVLAVGKGTSEVKAGDKIVYGGYVHNPIKIDGVEYLMIKQEDILGIVSKG